MECGAGVGALAVAVSSSLPAGPAGGADFLGELGYPPSARTWCRGVYLTTTQRNIAFDSPFQPAKLDRGSGA